MSAVAIARVEGAELRARAADIEAEIANTHPTMTFHRDLLRAELERVRSEIVERSAEPDALDEQEETLAKEVAELSSRRARLSLDAVEGDSEAARELETIRDRLTDAALRGELLQLARDERARRDREHRDALEQARRTEAEAALERATDAHTEIFQRFADELVSFVSTIADLVAADDVRASAAERVGAKREPSIHQLVVNLAVVALCERDPRFINTSAGDVRSEERRVGKECRL